MGDLTKNFSRKEFECHCGCGFNTIDYLTLMILQRYVRDYYEAKVTITSACRCFQHNMNTKGASRQSNHVFGIAVDFTVSGVSPRRVYNHIDRHFPTSLGLGLYADRVHLDSRKEKVRWGYKSPLY